MLKLKLLSKKIWIRGLLGVIFIAVSSTSASIIDLSSASAQTGPIYYVTVYANTVYGKLPSFETRVSPSLPTGATLNGSVNCTAVTNAQNNLVNIADQNGNLALDAGSYNLIPNDCTSSLSLSGTSGSIQLLGGPLVVAPDITRMIGSAEESKSTTNPQVAFNVAVINMDFDGSQSPGFPVSFTFEGATGLWFTACNNEVTAFNSTFSAAPATCTISGSLASQFLAGTGVWEATYAGSTDYVGSTFSLQVPAATTIAQASLALNAMFKTGQIQVVPDTTPPSNCHPGGAGVGLIGVSLSVMSCGQIQVLQILTGVIPTVVTAGVSIAVSLPTVGTAVAVNIGADLGREIPAAVFTGISESEDFGENIILASNLPTLGG